MNKESLPPLDALRVFEAAARCLSFTRAAEEMFITQSAVSKQVIALEAALGLPLFERRPRALLLTAAGERLQRAVELAFAELRAVAAELRGGGGEPTLTLATTQAFATFWLIPRLEDFRRHHPGIDIRISADTRVVDLERGRFDAAVRYLQDRNAPAGSLRLFGDTVVPVASPAYLEKSPVLARPADLNGHALLVYEDEEQRRPWLSWQVWLEMAGQPRLRPAGSIAFNQYASAIRAAIDGQGVALASLGLVADLLRSGRLVAPLPQRFANPRSYYLLLSARPATNPALAPFRAWLAAQAEAAGAPVEFPP